MLSTKLIAKWNEKWHNNFANMDRIYFMGHQLIDLPHLQNGKSYKMPFHDLNEEFSEKPGSN